ncbi:MAG: radical SAM family heme chaperone HemW [bacterium]|nr:radical SAM family heme chaperone HemW [bacterium]MCP4800882.1 radical SAM family heme chaperone HemW [bacterium]
MISRLVDKPPSLLKRGGGLYLHIPFCGSICSYCHFNRIAEHDNNLRKQFTESVIKELKLRVDNLPLSTIYVGGGTPSQLEPELLIEILASVRSLYKVIDDVEITCEANPESFTAELVEIWKSAGVNRISLGVQSLDQGVLNALGRQCNPETARAALQLATSSFSNVSADWILAPGCNVDQLKSAFNEAAELGVKHISFYILELHDKTKLSDRILTGELKMMQNDSIAELYKAGVEILEQQGFQQYEVSNFAISGYESKHNSAYWQRVPYIGIGPGASGFDGERRYTNKAGIKHWISCIQSGEFPEDFVDYPCEKSQKLEQLFLGLRTKAGVSLELFDNVESLEQGATIGLWEINKHNLVLTLDGMLQIDAIEEHLAGQLG